MGPEGNRNSMERQTEPTNLCPLVLLELELTNKEHLQAEPRPPHTYVADLQLGLHVGPEQLGLS